MFGKLATVTRVVQILIIIATATALVLYVVEDWNIITLVYIIAAWLIGWILGYVYAILLIKDAKQKQDDFIEYLKNAISKYKD